MNARFKRGIALLLTAVMVLATAMQSFAAPLGSAKSTTLGAEPAKITGTWSKDTAGNWHFSSQEGIVKDGWYYLNTTNKATEYNWFYFTNGVMNTGWVQDKTDLSVWYYTGETKDSSEGGLVKGWLTDPRDGRKYYTDPSTGIMCYGWKQLNGIWYYFGEKQYSNATHPYGSMYANERTPDGYYVGSTGAWRRNTSSGGGGSYTPPTPTPTTYTVTFDMNGHGEQIESKTGVVSGSKITAPTAPTAAGWKFKAWYKDSDCTTQWDFNNDTVTANTILYAKWAATVGYVIGNNFPQTGSSAWTNGNDATCYYEPMFFALTPSLVFSKTGFDVSVVFLASEVAKADGGYTYYSNSSKFTVTFNMDGDDLESIVFDADETATDSVKAVEGTYNDPPYAQ